MTIQACARLADVVPLVLGGAGPDRELDHLLAWHLAPDHLRRVRDGRLERLDPGHRTPLWMPFAGFGVGSARYTASLDAAMSVKRLGLPWGCGNDIDGPDPTLFKAAVAGRAMCGAPVTFTAVSACIYRAMLGAFLRERVAVAA